MTNTKLGNNEQDSLLGILIDIYEQFIKHCRLRAGLQLLQSVFSPVDATKSSTLVL